MILSVFGVMEDPYKSKTPYLLEKIKSKSNDHEGKFESKISITLPSNFHNKTSDMQHSTIATNVSTYTFC